MPNGELRAAAISGLGGACVIFLLAQLSQSLETTLLMAPFSASCVLVFAVPQAPLAQPLNVVFGHLISTLVGLAMLHVFGHTPMTVALAVGLAISAMQLSGTLHPPAGANPIVVMLVSPGWNFLAAPVLVGSLLIVAAGAAYHRFVSGRTYPMP